MRHLKVAAALGTSLIFLSACGTEQSQEADASEVQSPQTQFFYQLATLCGQAYAGERVVARPGRDLLEGDEALIVHFRECSENRIWAPFHIEKPEDNSWDRSRTWIYTLHDDHIELYHDHRHADGTPEDDSGYGGNTVTAGSPDRQMFIYTARTGEQGEVLGWRIEIVPGERYTYGTMADGDWTWRIDFDLSQPIEPPPAPWGYEKGE
ncbi:hypothetical protein [Aliidiomarina indica]|uniref:hypothetical protein n=1 Tax=Aliidiomarina indica TaxID=2749147 RepID=UPI00188DF898|nr:hypothetical protein [Aliidiomarina indica]